MLPEGFRIERQDADAAPVLGNLMEHYLHDMAEWFGFDTEADGAYHYDAGKCWKDDGLVYFAVAGDAPVPVGFALITRAEWPEAAGAWDLKEFFVVRRHRRSGVGGALAAGVWDRHPGPWLVRVFAGNRPAVPFWRRAVAGYTEGRGREHAVEAEGRHWHYFTFEAGRQARQ